METMNFPHLSSDELSVGSTMFSDIGFGGDDDEELHLSCTDLSSSPAWCPSTMAAQTPTQVSVDESSHSATSEDDNPGSPCTAPVAASWLQPVTDSLCHSTLNKAFLEPPSNLSLNYLIGLHVSAATQKRCREGSLPHEPIHATNDAAVLQIILKKPKTQEQEGNSLLHRTCCKPGVTAKEIKELLEKDPMAASCPIFVKSVKTIYNPIRKILENKFVKETYSYPLNLALKLKASPQVISLLIDAAPAVLSYRDGSMGESPLAVLLKNSPRDFASVDKMLSTYPVCVSMKDRHANTALHVACTHGASLIVVRHLYMMFPESLRIRNFHNKTPLELAQQRTSTCSDAANTYLRSMLG